MFFFTAHLGARELPKSSGSKKERKKRKKLEKLVKGKGNIEITAQVHI